MDSIKSRIWVFTWNNYEITDVALLQELYFKGIVKYLFVGFEVAPTTGTRHLQGYIQFKSEIERDVLYSKYMQCHLEPAKGTVKQNTKYCSKDGDYIELGNPPQQGRLNREEIENIMRNPFSNFHLFTMYNKSYKAAIRMERPLFHQLHVILKRHMLSKLELYSDVCYEPSHYDGEIAMFIVLEHGQEYLPSVTGREAFDPYRWYACRPQKRKLGFDTTLVDPAYIYIVVETDEELIEWTRRYSEIISKPEV